MKRLMEARYPIYATADITVESREVPHEVIVGEIIEALRERLGVAEDSRCRGSTPARRHEHGRPVAAPGQGGTGEPARIRVALGDRSYDVLIGPGLLARSGALIAERVGKARCAIVTDANVAQHHLATLQEALSAARSVRRRRGARARRGDQELPGAGAPVRAPARDGTGARRSGGGARRRRDRRSRRLRGQHRAARHPLRADPDDAAGAGRFLGRRQDRHQHAAGQEPGRRVSSAEPGAGRHRRCSRRCRPAQFRAGYVEMPPSTACSATPPSSPGWSRTGRRCSRRSRLR